MTESAGSDSRAVRNEAPSSDKKFVCFPLFGLSDPELKPTDFADTGLNIPLRGLISDPDVLRPVDRADRAREPGLELSLNRGEPDGKTSCRPLPSEVLSNIVALRFMLFLSFQKRPMHMPLYKNTAV
eukprot:481851-Rhodomonas_salina.2